MIVVLGGVDPLALPVSNALRGRCITLRCACTDQDQCDLPAAFWDAVGALTPDLIVVAGFRHLVPAFFTDWVKCVGFHHARLPEYPGRAPIPWALLRGDTVTDCTLLHLTDEPDAGDVIDSVPIAIHPGDTARSLAMLMGAASALLIREHVDGILAGTAPRKPQDRDRRGPLTTADGWKRLGQTL